MKLAVFTPLIRTANLPTIYAEVRKGLGLLPLRWFIVRDAMFRDLGAPVPVPDFEWMKEPWIQYRDLVVDGYGGERMLNPLIEELEPDEYFWVCADDNIPHPAFFPAMAALDGTAGAYTFSQVHKNGQVRKGTLVHQSTIDGAQAVVRRDFVRDIRYGGNWTIADGVFLEALRNRSPEGFEYLSDVLCFYNWLR